MKLDFKQKQTNGESSSSPASLSSFFVLCLEDHCYSSATDKLIWHMKSVQILFSSINWLLLPNLYWMIILCSNLANISFHTYFDRIWFSANNCSENGSVLCKQMKYKAQQTFMKVDPSQTISLVARKHLKRLTSYEAFAFYGDRINSMISCTDFSLFLFQQLLQMARALWPSFFPKADKRSEQSETFAYTYFI